MPLYEAGRVWHPPEHSHPWVGSLQSELLQFPFAAHDDMVDSVSQALNYLRDRGVEAQSVAQGLRSLINSM